MFHIEYYSICSYLHLFFVETVMYVKWLWRIGIVAVCILILPCYHIYEGLPHDQGVS